MELLFKFNMIKNLPSKFSDLFLLNRKLFNLLWIYSHTFIMGEKLHHGHKRLKLVSSVGWLGFP